MSAETIFYRLFRLRRLIPLAVGPLVLMVLGLGWLSGGVSPVLMLLAFVPLVHLVVYPTVWIETMSVAIVTGVVILLAATIGEDVGIVGLALRVVGLGILSVVLLFVLTSPLTVLLTGGEEAEVTSQATMRSKLDPETLRRKITLYPGRNDGRTVCSEADAEGVFRITTYQDMQAPDFHCAELDGLTTDGKMAIEYFGVVKSTGPDHHEYFSFEEPGGPIVANRHEFKALRRGTKVTMRESGAVMPKGMRFGFWVKDFMADYLTDEIDRAEGRPPRSNRSTNQRQLIVDIANLLMGRSKRRPAQEKMLS